MAAARQGKQVELSSGESNSSANRFLVNVMVYHPGRVETVGPIRLIRHVGWARSSDNVSVFVFPQISPVGPLVIELCYHHSRSRKPKDIGDVNRVLDQWFEPKFIDPTSVTALLVNEAKSIVGRRDQCMEFTNRMASYDDLQIASATNS
jgi:hypothetical protein